MAISDPKAPFFYKPVEKPRQVTMPVIQWVNDPQYRVSFGQWLAANFDSLVSEYKTHGRFLTLQEIEASPLEFSDLP